MFHKKEKYSQKDFSLWQTKCEKIARQLAQESKRISECRSDIEKTQTEEKSSTSTIENRLASTIIALNHNTIAHSEHHIDQLEAQQEALNDDQYQFLRLLQEDSRRMVEELATELKKFIKIEQDNYRVAQSNAFRFWLSRAEREIAFISREEESKSESEKVIFRRKLFQLTGYVYTSAKAFTDVERAVVITLLESYSLEEKDTCDEFHRLQSVELERESLTTFLDRENKQFLQANQQLKTFLAEHRDNNVEFVVNQVNKQPDTVLDKKIKTKILTSTYELVQSAPTQSKLNEYSALAKTVKAREKKSCSYVAGAMLLLLGGAIIIASILVLPVALAFASSAASIMSLVGCGLVFGGVGFFSYGKKQNLSHKMTDVSKEPSVIHQHYHRLP